MKAIAELVEKIDEELEGAKMYAEKLPDFKTLVYYPKEVWT